MPQEIYKNCRICSIKLDNINKIKKQNLCKICNSKLCKEYKLRNKENISKYNKEYKNCNKEMIKTYNSNYNIVNRTKIQERHTVYLKQKRYTDINYKITVNCRNKIKKFFKGETKSLSLIGCDINFLKEWLSYNFTKEMSFDNYGIYWHMDHVIPCYHFDMTNENALKTCFHWTNLQPLEAIKNLRKKHNINNEEVNNHWINVINFAIKKNIEVNKNNILNYIH